jgi:hypothetical protein
MVEAHGGLDRWRNAPSVRFTDHVTSPDGRPYWSSTVVVEQGRSWTPA